jgi:hypothetical protein
MTIQLPSRIVEQVSAATLPENYEAAKHALAACESLDQCAEWADRAVALASYARQADDAELENHARRIRARAVRRMGEILLTFDARGGDRSKNESPPGFAQEGISGPVIKIVSRTEAAADAGISEHKALTATRIASMDADAFEAAIEAPKAPGTTLLAKMTRMNQPPRDNISSITSGDMQEICVSVDCKNIISALQRLAYLAERIDLDRVVKLLLIDENIEALPTVRKGLNLAVRIKGELDRACLGARPFLKTVE